MIRPARRALFVLGLGSTCLLARPAVAQDPFEIEVYGHQTESRGEWELETHLNYVAQGTLAPDGSVAPTDHQAHLAFELTGGITDHWEVTAYALAAYRPGAGIEYAGWRVRSRVSAPGSWGLPVDLGFAAELEFTRAAYDEDAAGLELRPILEKRLGRFDVELNPVVEAGLRGQGGQPAGDWEMEPSARLAFGVSRALDLSVEYYGKTGVPGSPVPADERTHQVYPGLDLRLGDDVELNLGVGIGTTSAGDRLVLKGRFGIPVRDAAEAGPDSR